MASGSRPRPSAGACQRYRPAARTMPSSLGFPSRTDTRAHAVYPKDQPVNFDALAPAVLCRIVRSADQLGGRRVLSLGKLAPGQQEYYIETVARGAEEYYTGAKAAPGQRVGAAAGRLGLEGEVDD